MTLEQDIPEALVRRAQQGDAAAMSRLLAAARPRVYRWALVHTTAPDDAEDITQEALLRASRHIRDFGFAARFTTWLHTVTRHAAADWHRTRTRRAGLLREHHVPHAPVVQPAPMGALLGIVRDGMSGLPARQCEIFDLIDLQGYTPAEAAVLLDMNATTVRVHLLRARRTLRTRILASHPHIVEDTT